MKRLIVFGSVALAASSINLVAASPAGFLCVAQCITIDADHLRVVTLGQVTALSDHRKSEAWLGLIQKCKSASLELGYPEKVRTYLTANSYYQWFQYDRSIYGPNYTRFIKGDGGSILIEYATPEAQCFQDEEVPGSKPKYIGPGRPLG